jgi:flavin reductase (DIM6/NTAB) family NADH-FMN oxidoreductase RutF
MKTQLGAFPLLYPIPIVLVGATVEGRANFATLGQCGLMGVNPALVYVSSHRNHHTNQGILEHSTFSLNLPHTGMLALTDYCGTVSGLEVDKGALFDVFYGELGSAPMIRECPVNLECQAIEEFSVEHRQIFVGRVVQAYVDEGLVEERDGQRVIAGLGQLDPIIYALDNRYYRIGEPIGVGYQEGKGFRARGVRE